MVQRERDGERGGETDRMTDTHAYHHSRESLSDKLSTVRLISDTCGHAVDDTMGR